jgi:ATP-dependent protease ClpP protease subunit
VPNIDSKNLPFFLNEKVIAQWSGRWHAHRRALITGRIDVEMVKKLELQLATLDDEKIAPITLMLHSLGGEADPTQQVQDIIEMLQSPVYGIAIGDNASAAVDILQMCERRLVRPNSRLLVHYARCSRGWVCDDPEYFATDRSWVEESMAALRAQRFALYERRTGLSKEELLLMFRQGEAHGNFFSADQAVKIGLADEIVRDFKLFPRPEEETASAEKQASGSVS